MHMHKRAPRRHTAHPAPCDFYTFCRQGCTHAHAQARAQGSKHGKYAHTYSDTQTKKKKRKKKHPFLASFSVCPSRKESFCDVDFLQMSASSHVLLWKTNGMSGCGCALTHSLRPWQPFHLNVPTSAGECAKWSGKRSFWDSKWH